MQYKNIVGNLVIIVKYISTEVIHVSPCSFPYIGRKEISLSKMIPNIIFGFMFLHCAFASASKAYDYTVPQDQDGVNLPIKSGLMVPSKEEHYIGSIYVPTYHQETTYTFPEYESSTKEKEDDNDDGKESSLILTVLEFLNIPKKLALVMASGIFWTYKTIAMLVMGMVATIALCTYGDLCVISWQSPTTQFQPILHHFRSLATPARLEAASSLVKEAITKYRNLQSNKVNAN